MLFQRNFIEEETEYISPSVSSERDPMLQNIQGLPRESNLFLECLSAKLLDPLVSTNYLL